MRIRNLRKKILYLVLGVFVLGIISVVVGIQYLKSQFFKDHPNGLSVPGDLVVSFEWSPETYGNHTEPHNAMMIPVNVPGVPKQFFMQFDTGSPYSFVRSGAIQAFAERGVAFDLGEENDETVVKEFEIAIGGKSMVFNSGRVVTRGVSIDWDDDEAVSCIGTIGADFLEGKICSIDFPANQIRLFDSRPEYFDELGQFTPFSFKGRRVMLPSEINGDQVELFFDSGCSAFGLLTSKYHFDRYASPGSAEIKYDANRHGDPVHIHHKTCDHEVRLAGVDLPLIRVSYAELYTFLQSTIGRFVNAGVLGNKGLLESTIILDARSNEFMVVAHSLAESDPLQAAGLNTIPGKLAIIPFNLTESNNISIAAKLNSEHEVNLMFHTGVDSMSLTKATVEKLNMKMDQTGIAESWGGKSDMRFSSGNSLRIQDWNWNGLTITESQHSGDQTDGKFGPNLFAGKIIELDFEKSRMTIHDRLPHDVGDYDKLDIELDRGSMFVVGKLKIDDAEILNRFMIHSGFGGALLLDDKFVRDNQVGSRLETISESQLKDSYGNVLKTRKVILPSISFGDSTFTDVPIGIFDGAMGRQSMSVMGGEMLKRFKVLLDISNSKIYLQPNEYFHAEFQK